MTTLIDASVRSQATDTDMSFIVQAPAGSGKTEILTQRFLKLLSIVNAPEQIVALTFTRKAANEMRERIVSALQKAALKVPATSTHQEQTYDYARRALERDRILKWNILQQPARLRVITIDALCQNITHAIPLEESPIHYAQITNQPKALYLKAARACLRFANDDANKHEALKTLLYHFDNRQDTLLDLLSNLLSKRDQWLHPLYQARFQERAVFEEAIDWILQHELERFRSTLPKELADELILLVTKLAFIVDENVINIKSLKNWTSLEELDSKIAAQLASVLLTSQNTLRKAFDHHVGLKRGVCDDEAFSMLKQRSKLLLTQLDELPDFSEALIRISKLPNPEYDSSQWEVLQALFSLLPILVAHLDMLFGEQNTTDFTNISQQALLALGDEENPTDLALYLDNQIQHLLVDEFQDTSIQQFQLLNQLVKGWEPHDGRTLFVVGDPMQSIYRFRSAEVGLFLRAQKHGIGTKSLIPLELSCNFRSTSTIVNWVNKRFKNIFPRNHDIELGAVSFHSSTATKPEDETSYVTAIQCENSELEARALVERVVFELQTYPNNDIAILVRSRRQLVQIIKKLRAQNIPFQGVDIDLLANLSHIRDVWSLTQALLMPSSRLAWLSLLRSPWCGLSLHDIHCIAEHSKTQSIYENLSQIELMQNLSSEGRTRTLYIYNIMHEALIGRHQQPIVDWITGILQCLHLNKVLNKNQQDDLEQYWLLLEQHEEDGLIHDIKLFKEELIALYSKKVTPARLQIMTIHKSKGLEFDCVMLPGLGSKPRNLDAPLLRWLKLPTGNTEDILLLSPVKAAHEETCLLYNYLSTLDIEKDMYEQQRLLYVAATRAKKRLYLFDNHLTILKGTFRQLLNPETFETYESCEDSSDNEIASLPNLYKLPIDFYTLEKLPEPSNIRANPVNITNSTQRLQGIVAHELLQWICNNHPQTTDHIPWHIPEHTLTSMGFTQNEKCSAIDILKLQIEQLFIDPIGLWLIQEHKEEHNEYELLIEDNDTYATRIIDRTFYDKDVRWIIDFKTGEDSLKTEKKYRAQVNEYASLFANNETKPIRCGIYYLANSHWVEWEYQGDLIEVV